MVTASSFAEFSAKLTLTSRDHRGKMAAEDMERDGDLNEEEIERPNIPQQERYSTTSADVDGLTH
jgi:hypothetical protein